MTHSFETDRREALEEIRQACVEKVRLLATSPLGDNNRDRGLPEYIEVEEKFRLPAAMSFVIHELQQGNSLRQAFSYASARYRDKDRRIVNAMPGDLDPSPATGKDGRTSAFDDVLKALDIIERDFDLNYTPLSREDVRRWQKKHPIDARHIEDAHRVHARQFSKEAIDDMRALIKGIQHRPPAPPAANVPKI